MSTGAIAMMIVAMLVLWGGLGLAIHHLSRDRDDAADHVPPDS